MADTTSEAPEWVMDSNACAKCSKPFGLLRRVHHCRGCGRAFCDEDSSKRIELPATFKLAGKQRVCDDCYYTLVQASVESNPDQHPPRPDPALCKEKTLDCVRAIVGDSDDKWSLRADKKGVRIYTRLQSGSSVHTVRTVSLIPVPLEKVWTIYNDKALWPNWQPDLRECRTIERITESEEFLRVEFNLPVLDNRDLVFYNAMLDGTIEDPAMPRARTLIGCSVSHPLCPKVKGVVRAEMQYSMTTFEPVGSGADEGTRIVTILHIDVRGLIPPVIINQAVARGADSVVAMSDFMKKHTQTVAV